MVVEAVHVVGLKDLTKAVSQFDSELGKSVRKILNEEVAEPLAKAVRPKVPTLTGKARKSVRAASTRNKVRVRGGSKRVPYYPWLDFGGRVGFGGRVRRPFLKDGRYIYPTYKRRRDSGQIQRDVNRALSRIASGAGLDIEVE